MSLSSILRLREVRERFKVDFPKPKLTLSGEILAVPTHPSTSHAALVGTSFDYLMRLQVEMLNPGKTRSRRWVAESALARLASAVKSGVPVFPPDSNRSTRGLVSKAQRIVSDARDEYLKCLAVGRVSDDMIKGAVLLGQLEQFYRSLTLSETFGRVPPKAIADLKGLLKVAKQSMGCFRAKRLCALNPHFGKASELVEGADADILVDDTLIEVKTTKLLEFTAEMFRQLIGYYTLHSIARSQPRIRAIAVYFARYGVFRRLEIESIVDSRKFPEFKRWFVKFLKDRQAPRLICTVDGVEVWG